MNPKIELAEAERRTLEELSRNHPFRDFRLRALGVLALGKGHGLKLVSDILGVTAQSVRNWAKGWRKAGVMGLLNGHKGGRPPKLTPAMLDTAEAVARAEACGLREIARRVKEAHPEAPPFSLDRLAAWLKARGLSWKRTRLSLKKKRCPERFEAARDDLKRCQAAAREGRIALFYLDECGFANIPNVRRSWSPKGQPHEAAAGVSRKRANVVGALDYATGQLWHEVHDTTVRGGNVVDLIDRIARREDGKPLTLVVLDNASMHHAIDPEKLEDWLVNHRLVLMHLPPYSPELNLVERVWRQAKHHWRKFVTWDKDKVREEVANLMADFGTAYKISFA
jgi:transposase